MFIVILLRAHLQRHGSGVAGYADSGAVDADGAILDLAPLGLMCEQGMRLERHADLFPTAECAAALRLVSPIDGVGSDGSALAAGHAPFPSRAYRFKMRRSRFLDLVLWIARCTSQLCSF